MKQRPIGILYEHPEWFKPLFAELERRDVPFEPIHAAGLVFDPARRRPRHSLLVNRMSPSAWTRGNAGAIFHARDYLAHAEEIGTPVVNGRRAYELELSKARQVSLLASLGIAHPRTRVINDARRAVEAAAELEFPVLIKPNIGGSGAGIRSFANADELAEAAGSLDLGLDGTALVQEHLRPEGDAIVRVEILNGELLYAIRIRLMPGSFNLCPADYCDLTGLADPIEAYEPPDEVVDDVKRIVAGAGMDIAGVEYLVDSRNGRPTFYDVNALSNFVANAPQIVGFDPFVTFVDAIVERAGFAASIAAA